MAAAITIPLDCFVALSGAPPAGELVGNGYMRMPGHFEYCVDGITIANPAPIQWPKALADWAPVGEVQLFDSQLGGNLLVALPSAASVTVGRYDIGYFAPTDIQLGLSPVARPFGVLGFGTGPFGVYSVLAAAASDAGSAYSLGGYSLGPYEAIPHGPVLRLLFDTSTHVCEPGVWTPGPFMAVAA